MYLKHDGIFFSALPRPVWLSSVLTAVSVPFLSKGFSGDDVELVG